MRILELARVLQALDNLGARRVLLSVRDAADRDILNGLGLQTLCFHPSTDRDSGLLLASRLSKQPFIDGKSGLFAAHEGVGAIEALVQGKFAFGAGLAALTDGFCVALASASKTNGGSVTVNLTYLDEDSERNSGIEVPSFVTENDIELQRLALMERIERAVADGRALIERVGEMFPRLRFGSKALDQLSVLTGNEPVFRQLLRHLRLLNSGAETWLPGTGFEPDGITYSVESRPTLNDGTLGPMRDFPVPAGFEAKRWSLHTKLTGGAGARLYFRAEQAETGGLVLIGYFGDHLPTVRYRT